ncbi:hypothetical protein YC2023_033415 [Brassica napus]
MIFWPFCFERKSASRLMAEKKLKNKKGCNTRTSREVTNPSTALAQARFLQSSDGIRCISAGMIAPVSTSLSFLYILFLANPSARPWGPHDFLAVLIRAKKCVEVNGVKKA